MLLFIRIGALSVSFVSMRRLVDDEPEGFTGGMTLRKAISLTKVQSADMRPLFMLTGVKTGLSAAALARRLRFLG